MKEKNGRPPFEELRQLIEMTGYEVISIGVDGDSFPGIKMRIAPKSILEHTDFIDYPQIPQGLLSRLRECTALPPQQSQGSGE